jgi:ANTAR domain
VISEDRAVIVQAKGVLMAAFGITANRAFEVLVWRSQETHLSTESRSQIDHALLTLR